ncbi:MAG: hypothetical protein KAS53_00570 [Candidatus Cloacimonetes bacterium]|nr:hypothetical protein [Candidatus Cloacimonadota bacterium]
MKEAISEFIKFVTILLILITGILIMKHYEYKNFKLLLDSNKIEVTNDFNIEGLNGVEIPKKTKYEVDRRKDILSNMKTYNEILYQKQSDTFQVIIYILAIFSIVAGFFGYKTIKDIREKALQESEKLSEFYKQTFSLLNNQAEISKDFYNEQYSGLTIKVKEEREKIENLSKTVEKLYEDIKKVDSETAKKIKSDNLETEKIKEDEGDKVTEDVFEVEND